MRTYFYLLTLLCIVVVNAQEVRMDGILFEDIYTDWDRDDRVKNVENIKKVVATRTDLIDGIVKKKEFWYEKGLYVRAIESSHDYVTTYTKSYDNLGRIKELSSTFKELPVTDSSSLWNETSKYFYAENKVEEHFYKRNKFEYKTVYELKDGIIQKCLLYDTDGLAGLKSDTYLKLAYRQVWNYIERITTSKESIYEEKKCIYNYDDEDRIISISCQDGTKDLFTYKDNLLISSKFISKIYTSNDTYEYDAYGNWIKKTETEDGEIIYITTRTITYIN